MFFSFICSECSINSLPLNYEETINSSSDVSGGSQGTDYLQGTIRPSMSDPRHFECFQHKGLHFIHMNVRSLLN